MRSPPSKGDTMPNDRTEKDYISLETQDVKDAGRALMAASSIIVAACDQYAHTGNLSVGAVLHAGNVVDNVIESLGLAELLADSPKLPF